MSPRQRLPGWAGERGVTLMGAYLPGVKRAVEILVSLVFSKICAAGAVFCDAKRASAASQRDLNTEKQRVP